VVFIGLNDYYFNPNADPNQVVTNVMAIVQKIWDQGGTDFLIPRLPALGSVPYFVGGPQMAQLNQLCVAHNNFLTVRLPPFFCFQYLWLISFFLLFFLCFFLLFFFSSSFFPSHRSDCFAGFPGLLSGHF